MSGVGCSGSAGPLELSTAELPWTGTTFECTAAGFAPSAFGISVWGLTPVSTPLISLFSQGLAGCSLFATPDATRLLLPVAGVATTSITLPNDLTFANLVLHHQALAFEFGSATPGVVAAVASTNGLAVTIGSF
ncbi:MAG: hypothetical protein NXI31_13795 [bacterium]|nr:hypothetical protein [bacterium]